MKKPFKLRYLEKIVSVFVFLAIFLLSSMIIFLAKQKKVFSSKVNYHTTINSLEKISKGQEIILRGPNIPIGKVTDFSITKDNRVRVDFFIYDEYRNKIRTDTVIMFSAPLFGLLGSYKVEVTTGNTFYPILEDGDMIPSNQMQEGLFLLSVNRIQKDKKEIPLIDKLNPLLDNLTKILNPRSRLIRSLTSLLQHTSNFSMQLSEQGVFHVLGSRAFRSNLEKMLYQINVLLSSGDRLVNTNMKKTLGDLSLLLNNAKNTTDTINYNLPKVFSQLNAVLYRLQRMAASLETSPIFSGGKLKRGTGRSTRQYFQGQ